MQYTRRSGMSASALNNASIMHYENMPIQIYWKIYHQKMKIFR